MRRPTFLRVYSSDATEKDDEATPINRSDSDDVRNSIDNNELHLYTELHNDEQMLMFRPTTRNVLRGSPRSARASRSCCAPCSRASSHSFSVERGGARRLRPARL